MEKKFQAGDKVILEHRNFRGSTYSIEYIDKIYKTGNFVLKGDKQQYNEHGRQTGDVGFGYPKYVRHYTDELWETSFKPQRIKSKKRNITESIEKIDDESILDEILKLIGTK